MDCSERREVTGKFLDDELDEARREETLDHLDHCAQCLTEMIDLDPTLLFSRLRHEPIPQSVKAGFFDPIREEIEKPAGLRSLMEGFWRSVRTPALRLAPAVLLVGLFSFALTRGTSQQKLMLPPSDGGPVTVKGQGDAEVDVLPLLEDLRGSEASSRELILPDGSRIARVVDAEIEEL